MHKPDQVILLNTNSQLIIKVVDNRNGVLVQLVTASDAKTVDATLMWTPYGEDRVTFINRKPLLEYRCTDCDAEFTECHNYCPECGADEVMYIPDLEEEEA
jgi:Zn finger protein HypA/HybF involved in hydrogenase expression